jgi:transposase InsO family protein
MTLLDMGMGSADSMTIQFAEGMQHLMTMLTFDFGEVKAIIDTGSPVCFLSEKVLRKLAPLELDNLKPCPISFKGISGESFGNRGIFLATVKVGNKVVQHPFVIANICESALLGIDFIQKYKLAWDWWSERAEVSMSVNLATTANSGHLTEDVYLDPGTVQTVSLQLLDPPVNGTTVMVTGCSLDDDLFITDTLCQVHNGEVWVEVGNDGPSLATLPSQIPMANWQIVGDDATVLCVSELTSVSEVPVFFASQGEPDEKELPEELLKTVEGLETLVSRQDYLAALNLLASFKDVFALKGEPLGNTDLMKHRIDVGDALPSKEHPRRIPIHQVDAVEKEILKMLSDKIIEPSESPWAAPVVIVKKKDGTYRFCVDYRRLNNVTRKDAYPLPRVDENLDALAGNDWFSSLDLASGYWQVQMEDADKAKTAFVTRFGFFHFNVMPFGLCNAPATFQRLMERVLRGLQWKTLVLYLDDVVIFGTSFMEHLERLKQVFLRLREAGLKLKPKKCALFKKEVSFLGHVVNGEGVHTDPEKVEKIAGWPVPKSVHDIRVFTGLTSYYRAFIPEYAKRSSCLHDLTKKGVEWRWGDAEQKAFEYLKSVLTKEIALSFPVKNGGDFILDTDACNTAIGAALHQIQDGKEKLLRFGSRCLNPAERNYCTTRKELWAVVFFLHYFRHYLLGDNVKVVVRTDHGSLQWLKNFKDPADQVARWLEKISVFRWFILHRAGVKHGNADALSRRPCDGNCKQCAKIKKQLDPKFLESMVPEQTVNLVGPKRTKGKRGNRSLRTIRVQNRKRRDRSSQANFQSIWDKPDLVRATAHDSTLKVLLGWTTRPTLEDIADLGHDLKFFYRTWGNWKIHEGLVWYRWLLPDGHTQWKLVVPKVYVPAILAMLHDTASSGHLGEKRSVKRLLGVPLFWFGFRKDMRSHCRTCDSCFRSKSRAKHPKVGMQHFSAGFPLERMAVDVAGPFHSTTSQNRFIVVAMDYFTKYVSIIPVPNHKAETVAKVMVNEVFTKIGIPCSLHSDMGSDFVSHLFTEVCRIFQIDKTRTSPFRPQSDGMVERFNRTMGMMLRQFVSNTQEDWDEFLSLCAMAYNSSVHNSTGYTPNFLMFGREFKLPIEYMLPCPDFVEDDLEDSIEHYVARLKDSLCLTYEVVRNHTKKAVNSQRVYYERRTKPEKFRVGQSVWYYCPVRRVGFSPKLCKPWTGPFFITQLIGKTLARIKKSRLGQYKVVHLDTLAPTKKRFEAPWFEHLPVSRKPDPKGSDEVLLDLRCMFDPKKVSKKSSTSSGQKRTTRSGKTY